MTGHGDHRDPASCGSSHDRFVRFTLSHYLLDCDSGSREQYRGLIHVRFGGLGPRVLNILDGVLGADQREERFGVIGLWWDGPQQDHRTVRASELPGPRYGAEGTSRSINWSKNDGHPICSYAEPGEPHASRVRRHRNQSRASTEAAARVPAPRRGDSLPARGSSPRTGVDYPWPNHLGQTPNGHVSGVSSGDSNPGSASIGCTADVRSICSTVSNC